MVSLIVACRNERSHIERCLTSLLEQSHPAHKVEILVIDGMSDDGSRAIIQDFSVRHPRIRWLNNFKLSKPAAVNLGIRIAAGDFIFIIDAHSDYRPDYVSKCLKALIETNADNVGGVLNTLPGADTPMARAIAFALAHPFGVGNARFRIGSRARREVDTVPFGCYRADVFRRIGGFDEELIRNQDDEFNHRLIRSGGRIVLDPDIVTDYFARDSLTKVWRMYYQYGLFKPMAARKIGRIPTLRQLAPPLFVLGIALLSSLSLMRGAFLRPLALLLALYGGAAASASIHAVASHAVAPRDSRAASFLPVVFATLHLAYGLGYWHGLASLALGGRQAIRPQNIPLSR